MRISILGAGGFLGQKLARRLAADGTVSGTAIETMVLFDLAAPAVPEASFPITALGGDLAELPAGAIPPGTDVVFHLAAVVSAAAEADYELGRRVNVRGTDAVIDACRALAAPPRVVFTSSVGSYSALPGGVLSDDSRQIPAGSYGAQKAACELFLADASRRGFMDAVCLRLPTIAVRPGRPNKAASSFISAIVREPLLGLDTDLPVDPSYEAWIASPRRAVEWLLHAAIMDTAPMGLDRALNPPGITVTIGEMLEALEQVRQGAGIHVHRRADPVIERIVLGWHGRFDAARARELGFASHETLIELVRAFVEDDLEPTRRERGLV